MQKYLFRAIVLYGFFCLAACYENGQHPSSVTAPVVTGDTSKSSPPASSSANQGGDVSGGGAGEESEFKSQVTKLIERMEKVGFFMLPFTVESTKSISVEDLKNALKSAKISFIDKKLIKVLDGTEKEVDALNYPSSQLIEVNIDRWKALGNEARDKLVLHELYGLMEVEKDIYENSIETLSTLQRLEHPADPKDQCPLETQGGHEGDACLTAILYELNDGISAMEETLLSFSSSTASTDGDHEKTSKEKIKKYIETFKEAYEPQLEQTCRGVSLTTGNYAAYEASLCEIKFARQRLDLLTQFYNKVKASFPQIPYPRKAEAWNG